MTTISGMMPDDQFPWPEPGRKFFEFGRSRPDAYSWVRRSIGEYAYMYRESAQRLMDLACDAPGLLNVHAIPGVFLFRHYVELSLKGMLVDAGRLNDRPGSFPDGHQLRGLWSALRKLMVEAQLAETDEEQKLLDVVEAMISELDTTDPGSMAFRYPVGTSSAGRQPLLGDEFEYFDMQVFRDQAQRLAAFIDGCTAQLDEYMQIKQEMDQHFLM